MHMISGFEKVFLSENHLFFFSYLLCVQCADHLWL